MKDSNMKKDNWSIFKVEILNTFMINDNKYQFIMKTAEKKEDGITKIGWISSIIKWLHNGKFEQIFCSDYETSEQNAKLSLYCEHAKIEVAELEKNLFQSK